MDISGFFNVYLSGVLNVAKKYYDTLDSITFGGVSVLDFAVTLVLLSVVVPMVITLVHTYTDNAFYGYEYGRDLKKREKVQERNAKKALKKKEKAARRKRNERGVV